jgi:transcriptional regulator with XRE-family HTH domain
MDSDEFKSWRKSLGLKQKEAAEKLGLKKRMIQYYETGRRGSKKVVIPKTVELACYALSVGVGAFDGSRPERADALPGPGAADRPGDKKARLSQEAA